jgi:hypothetical protein
MASAASSNGGGSNGATGRQGGLGNRDSRVYSQESTVTVNLSDNGQLTASSVINSIEESCGAGAVFACVPKPGNMYEVTMADRSSVQIVLDGVQVNDCTLVCREVVQTSMVVSFMHLSAYVLDEEISQKLLDLKVELLDDIKRHYYKGTQVADGTRYVRIRLPTNVKSLPYSMKFYNGKSYEFAKVLHNNQIRVCSECLSDDHLYKQCPLFTCHRCGGQGHTRRQCKATLCPKCREFDCVCEHDNLDPRCRDCNEMDCVCNWDDELCENCDKTRKDCRCYSDSSCRSCGQESDQCGCACNTCGYYTCQCERSRDWWGDEDTVADDKAKPVTVEQSSHKPADSNRGRDGDKPKSVAVQQSVHKPSQSTRESVVSDRSKLFSGTPVTYVKENVHGKRKADSGADAAATQVKHVGDSEVTQSVADPGASREKRGEDSEDSGSTSIQTGLDTDKGACEGSSSTEDEHSQMDCDKVMLKRRSRLVNYDSVNPHAKSQRTEHYVDKK